MAEFYIVIFFTVHCDNGVDKFCIELLFFYIAVEGFETARALALHGARVVLACRNMRSANNAVDAIKHENTSADVEAMFVDLTSLITVQKFACSYISRNMYALHSQYTIYSMLLDSL